MTVLREEREREYNGGVHIVLLLSNVQVLEMERERWGVKQRV